MPAEVKLQNLQELDERDLQSKLLVPLLNRMGYKGVTVYHGPRERGKDIVCFEYDRLHNREHLGVVVKTGDLDGSVSSSSGLREVTFQAEQCLDVPYEDLFGMKRLTMDRVWVVTSGRIIPGAADSVYAHLEKQNLAKLVRFIAGQNLVELIDEYYPEYWNATIESAEKLTERAARLESFSRKLLISLMQNYPDCCRQVVHNEAHVRLASGTWYVAGTLRLVSQVSLLLVLCLNAVSSGFRLGPFLHALGGNQFWTLVPILAVFLISIFLRRRIEGFFHYQRMREVLYVLETGFSAFGGKLEALGAPFNSESQAAGPSTVSYVVPCNEMANGSSPVS